MDSREIGIPELRDLVGRHLWLIVGLSGLFGLAAFGWTLWPTATQEATARLVVYPEEVAGGRALIGEPASMLTSQTVLRRATEMLVEDGVFRDGRRLSPGPGLRSRVYDPESRISGSVIVMLTARDASAEVAAAIANAWARVVIEESVSASQGTSLDAGRVLEENVAEARMRLVGLEEEGVRLVQQFQSRGAKIDASWERRIREARLKGAESLTGYHLETLRLMKEALDPNRAEGGEGATAERDSQQHFLLLQLASVRARLAETPRVLTLENTVRDETPIATAGLAGRNQSVDRPTGAETSQAINPLYDQLLLKALELEGELKRPAQRVARIYETLAAVEAVQLQRGIIFEERQTEMDLELRALRQSQRLALQTLGLQRAAALAEYGRALQQERALERQLVAQLNKTAVSGLLEQVKWVKLLSPASPNPIGRPRRTLVKVGSGIVLGAFLGLMIALFRSTGA